MDPYACAEEKFKPKFFEALIITFVTLCFTLICLFLSEAFFNTSQTRLLIPWFIHLPLFIIPLIWYKHRLKPVLPSTYPHIFSWPRKSTKIFLVFAVLLVTVNLFQAKGYILSGQLPFWAKEGPGPLILGLLFQGGFVGISEEMFIRIAVHLPLRLRLRNEIKMGLFSISWAAIITSVIFGSIHLLNVLAGKPLIDSLYQSVYAAMGAAVLGWYYERTSNFLGTAMLHNLVDVSITVASLMVSWI